jgi:predicted transcriptional regulator
LLEAIVEHEPESIRKLARLVDRNPPEVLENVNKLADYGLIELEAEGPAKRPGVWCDNIDVELPLTTPSDRGRNAKV